MNNIEELRLLAERINIAIDTLESRQNDLGNRVDDLLKATTQIQALLTEPEDFHSRFSVHNSQFACLRWICYFNIPKFVQLAGAISYEDLATTCNVPIDQLKRVLRTAMTSGLFHEISDNQVAHTKLSARLMPGDPFLDACNFLTQVPGSITPRMLEMTKSWDSSADKNKLAFNIAFNTDLPMYAYIPRHPELSSIFGGAMKFLSGGGMTDLVHLVNGFDWSSLGKAKVLDIGGSSGTASIALASHFQNLTFVVQDLPDVIARARIAFSQNTDYSALESRITFEAHDFFRPQPVSHHDVDVYLFRQVFNNWPDHKVQEVLSHTITIMKPGARIVMMNTLLPKPGTLSVLEESKLRTADLFMLLGMGGKDRDLDELSHVLAGIDKKLIIKDVQKPIGSSYSVIEIGYP